MPSFKNTVAFMATALFAIGAQGQITYVIDPNSVPIATRENWCTSQRAACPLLCLQLEGSSSTTETNTCEPETLDYQCICGNGEAPSAASYSQTIPYFKCTEYGNQCVAACGPHDSTCQTACRVNNPCGAQDPAPRSTSTSSSAPPASKTDSSSPDKTDSSDSSSTTGGAKATGTDSSDTSSPTSSNTGNASPTPSTNENGAQSALDLARSYGLAVMFTGVFAAFALVM